MTHKRTSMLMLLAAGIAVASARSGHSQAIAEAAPEDAVVPAPATDVAAPAVPAEAVPVGAVPVEAQPRTLWQAADLQGDTALQAKISLEARRMPLSDLLTEMQKQSGVAFTAGDTVAATRLVTARVHDMALADLMGALSRLYGVGWQKNAGAGYLMQKRPDLDDLHINLLRLGDMAAQPTLQEAKAAHEKSDALANEVLNEVGPDDLQAKEGVKVSALPAELQAKVRAHLQTYAADNLLEHYLKMRRSLDQELTLHFEKKSRYPNVEQTASGYVMGGIGPGLKLLDPKGQLITRVSPTFPPPPLPAGARPPARTH